MAESHKKNHYIPKAMLKHWEVCVRGRYGVHVHTIAEDRRAFASSRGRIPYPFAIAEDLYVPNIAGKRATVMEGGWLAEMERVLAHFIHQVHVKAPLSTRDPQNLSKLSMALIGLEQRSRYNIQKIVAFIEQEPALRAQVAISSERSTHRIVLENLINYVTELHGRLAPMEFTFEHAGESEFIIGDRPSITDERMAERIAVLTNKVAVVYTQSQRELRYRYLDANEALVASINHEMAMNAREWLVARDPNLLDRYVAVVRSDQWRQRVARERRLAIQPQFVRFGWRIPEPEG